MASSGCFFSNDSQPAQIFSQMSPPKHFPAADYRETLTLQSSLLAFSNNSSFSPELQEFYFRVISLKSVFQGPTGQEFEETLSETRILREKQAFSKALEAKTLKLKDLLKFQALIVEQILKFQRKSWQKVKETCAELREQRQKLRVLSATVEKRRAFEHDFAFEIAFFRRKVESLHDFLKEIDAQLAIFAVLREKGAEKPRFLNSFEDQCFAESAFLAKYEEYHAKLKKIDLIYQDFLEFFALDCESPAFLKKSQALLAVIAEIWQFLKENYAEIVEIVERQARILEKVAENARKKLGKFGDFFENYENSYANVEKIIYLRVEKIQQRLRDFPTDREEILEKYVSPWLFSLESLEIHEDFFENLAKARQFAVDLRGNVRIWKKNIRFLRDDCKNLYFVKIRLIQSKKALRMLDFYRESLNSLVFLVSFARNTLPKHCFLANFLLERGKSLGFQRKSAIACRFLQADMRNLIETLRKCVETRDFAPISAVPRKLLRKLEEMCQKLDNFKEIDRGIPRENAEIQGKFQLFCREFHEFFEKTQRNLRENQPFHGKTGNSKEILKGKAAELREMLRKHGGFAKELEFLGRSEKIIAIFEDFFAKLAKLRGKWLDDREFVGVFEDERDVYKLIENFLAICEDLPEKYTRNREFLREIRKFIEDFQEKKRENREKQGKIREFLEKSAKNYEKNAFLREIISELLRNRGDFFENQRELANSSENLLKSEEISKNSKKIHEFSNVLSPKIAKVLIFPRKGDSSEGETDENPSKLNENSENAMKYKEKAELSSETSSKNREKQEIFEENVVLPPVFMAKAEKFTKEMNKNLRKPSKNTKKAAEDSDDSSEDRVYGWDTYYISNTLNKLFGLEA